MTARADAAERTGERITDAMLRRFAELPYDRIRLEDVAADAGVTVQTVIRRFGTKHGVLAATVEREFTRLATERAAAMGNSPQATLHSLVRYYEDHGALILKLYAEAAQAPGVPELASRGRSYHVSWCREAFAEALRPTVGQKDQGTTARPGRRYLRRHDVADSPVRRPPLTPADREGAPGAAAPTPASSNPVTRRHVPMPLQDWVVAQRP